ncbi:hypothetical protein LEN26_011067 [Aphanomyces euteiches]|nr:hypothetical protein AeMF1_019244 [Aphanomyces euteiches]KAH9120541.1 hypothetical protein LEN26_011067 [Aphanomyces euteiches]
MVTQLEVNAKVQHDVGKIGAHLAQTANEFQTRIATKAFIQQHLEERLFNSLEGQFNAQSAATGQSLAAIVDKQQATQNMVNAVFDRVNTTLEEQLEVTHARMTAICDNLQLEQQGQSEKIESIMLQQAKQNQALLEMVQQTTKSQEQLTLRSKQLDDKLDKLVAESETHLINQVTNMSTQIVQTAWADNQNSSNNAQLSFQKSITDSVAHAQLTFQRTMTDASDAAMARQQAWLRQMHEIQEAELTKMNELLKTKLTHAVLPATTAMAPITPTTDPPSRKKAGSATKTNEG